MISEIISLIAVLVSIFTLFWNYFSKIKHELFLEKLRIYQDYLVIISLSVSSPEEQKQYQLINKHIKVKQELVLLAPKEIVETVANIEPINFTKENEFKYEMYLNLLQLMRKDLKRNKPIQKEYLKKLFG